MTRTYIEPKVTLVDSIIEDLGYFIWLKSRQWIIKDEKGELFMRDMEYPDEVSWISSLPKNFYVGDELVDRYEYRERINKMNLQYNNFEQFVFEIDGSCLFRDMLFNLNKTSQWAQSNRFLFSILDEVERNDSKHYHISAEYKDIPEWENQFDEYMKAIQDDPIVDHNRIHMPYSISSTFWISINKKTIIDFLSFLKFNCPFFYEVYGVQFMKLLYIKESDLVEELSASISQYILDTWEEGSWIINDTVIIGMPMGLILYSQFIRQADTIISGLYNEMMHNDIETFKHKVFSGGTVININYVANKNKVKSTIRTRLCSFAMSSGDGPCSWNSFIKKFAENLNGDNLIDYLPCKVGKHRIENCKFYDDVKFRNEGKEISNCPCPLITLRMKDAEAKRDRDQNDIGNAFFELTAKLTDELDQVIEFDAWTSKLIIKFKSYEAMYVPKDIMRDSIEHDILNPIKDVLSKFDNDASNYPISAISAIQGWVPEYLMSNFLGSDLTYILKGLAIDRIINYFENILSIKSYLIDFGGDIYARNVHTQVQIDNTNFFINIDGNYSIFTSGNTAKRGNHIPKGPEHKYFTTVVKWLGDDSSKHRNVYIDAISTKNFAEEYTVVDGIMDRIEDDIDQIQVFEFTEDGILDSKVYCASPFFDDEQRAIRDKMISKCSYVFRPDLTESSLEYDKTENPTDEQLQAVVDDNFAGLSSSMITMFPKYTDDLGTLVEVGVSMSYYSSVIAYDHKVDKYIINLTSRFDNGLDIMEPEGGKKYLFDCSNKQSVISLGYLSVRVPADDIYYQLKGCKDNIMLSNRFHHVENINGEFKEIKRNNTSKDYEGSIL